MPRYQNFLGFARVCLAELAETLIELDRADELAEAIVDEEKFKILIDKLGLWSDRPTVAELREHADWTDPAIGWAQYYSQLDDERHWRYALGYARGLLKVQRLNKALAEAGRWDDLTRAGEDKAVFEELLEELDIEVTEDEAADFAQAHEAEIDSSYREAYPDE